MNERSPACIRKLTIRWALLAAGLNALVLLLIAAVSGLPQADTVDWALNTPWTLSPVLTRLIDPLVIMIPAAVAVYMVFNSSRIEAWETRRFGHTETSDTFTFGWLIGIFGMATAAALGVRSVIFCAVALTLITWITVISKSSERYRYKPVWVGSAFLLGVLHTFWLATTIWLGTVPAGVHTFWAGSALLATTAAVGLMVWCYRGLCAGASVVQHAGKRVWPAFASGFRRTMLTCDTNGNGC